MHVHIFWLFLAGGFGALSRYLLSGLIQARFGAGFPAGTFLVNMIGCFFFGLIWSLAEERLVPSPGIRMIVLTGFFGAFTTFSTFVFETQDMIRLGQWTWALVNAMGQNAAGILLLVAGMALGKWL